MANHHLLDWNIDGNHHLLDWNINAFCTEISMIINHRLLDWYIDDNHHLLDWKLMMANHHWQPPLTGLATTTYWAEILMMANHQH